MPSPSFPVPVLQGGRMSVDVCVCVPRGFQRFNRGKWGVHNLGNLRLESVQYAISWSILVLKLVFGFCLGEEATAEVAWVSFLLVIYIYIDTYDSDWYIYIYRHRYHMVPCWEFHWTCTIDLKQFRVAKLLTLGHVGGESFLSMISTILSNSSWLCYWTIAWALIGPIFFCKIYPWSTIWSRSWAVLKLGNWILNLRLLLEDL